MANQRIKYSSLPSNFVDGRILNAEDLNKIIRFTVAGINANKEDLDKLLSGKYNSHIFYSLSELTPTVGFNGDYAFIFFSDEISGPDRDTLKAYKKELNVWHELGELSLISLYEKLELVKNVDTTYVGAYPPVMGKYNVWIKTNI